MKNRICLFCAMKPIKSCEENHKDWIEEYDEENITLCEDINRGRKE